MSRLITIAVIGFVLLLLGYFGKDAAVDDPSPAQTESMTNLSADAEASSTGIDLQALEGDSGRGAGGQTRCPGCRKRGDPDGAERAGGSCHWR